MRKNQAEATPLSAHSNAMAHAETNSPGRARKRLLIVSREFPPSKLIAGQRVGAFSKFLPESGIAVHVITENTGKNCASNRTFPLKQVLPDCASEDSQISYVAGDNTAGRLVERVSGRLEQACRLGGLTSPLARAVRKPLSAYAFLTYGKHNIWVRNTVQQAIITSKQSPFDGVFASFGGEYWNLGAASRISRRLGIPLFLDFRDGWDWFFGFNGKRSRIYPMMRSFVSRSSLISGATQSVIDRLLEFWPDIPVTLVPNGFDIDRESLAIGSQSPSNLGLKIGYFGTVWPNPRWSLLCQALERVATTTPIHIVYRGRNPEQIPKQLPWGGAVPPGISLDIGSLCERSEIFTMYGEVDLVIAAAAQENQLMGCIPAKLIEAIGFAKPFVALADRSPEYLHEFLKDCPSPYLLVDDETRTDQIQSFILELRHRPPAPHQAPEAYSARRRACQLAETLINKMK